MRRIGSSRAPSGQTATEYMLVISVIVCALVAAAYLFVPEFQGGVAQLAQDVSVALATGQVGGIGFSRHGGASGAMTASGGSAPNGNGTSTGSSAPGSSSATGNSSSSGAGPSVGGGMSPATGGVSFDVAASPLGMPPAPSQGTQPVTAAHALDIASSHQGLQ